jgi:hypothetical protein
MRKEKKKGFTIGQTTFEVTITDMGAEDALITGQPILEIIGDNFHKIMEKEEVVAIAEMLAELAKKMVLVKLYKELLQNSLCVVDGKTIIFDDTDKSGDYHFNNFFSGLKLELLSGIAVFIVKENFIPFFVGLKNQIVSQIPKKDEESGQQK